MPLLTDRWRAGRIRMAVVVGAAALIAAVAGCGGDKTGDAAEEPEMYGLVRPEPLEVGDLRVPEVTRGDAGVATPLRAGRDGYMALFFGFTRCPDLCPLTLAKFSSALERLPAPQAAAVEVAMVTVDPATDEPAQLRDFLGNFSDNYRAFRPTDREHLARVEERVFAASFEETAPPGDHEGDDHDSHQTPAGEAGTQPTVATTDTPAEPTISHTGYLYLVDDTGTVVVEWPADTTTEQFAADLQQLLPAGTTTDS